MIDRKGISLKAQSFFDDLWARGDPWELEASDFERERYARLIAMLDRSKYARILEIGCGAGAFSRLLAPMAQQLIALDVGRLTRSETLRGDRATRRRGLVRVPPALLENAAAILAAEQLGPAGDPPGSLRS